MQHEHEFEAQLSSEDYNNPVYMCECGATQTAKENYDEEQTDLLEKQTSDL